MIDFISQKGVKKNTLDKMHLRNDRVNGSILNGFQEPVFCSITLVIPAVVKIYSEPETIHFWKNR